MTKKESRKRKQKKIKETDTILQLTYMKITMTPDLEKRKYIEEQRKKYGIKAERFYEIL